MSTVQWFPGHMAKTARLITENLKRIHLVIEVLDARAPQACANPLLHRITASKPRLIILNKNDLADPEITALGLTRLARPEIPAPPRPETQPETSPAAQPPPETQPETSPAAQPPPETSPAAQPPPGRTLGRTLPLTLTATERRGISALEPAARELCYAAGLTPRRTLRALIAGIPNSGKSTIINALCRRRRAETGAKPGLTRDLRRIPAGPGFELFDSPGLLPHKFENPETGYILAALGSVKETILPEHELTARILLFLARRYPRPLQNRYRLSRIPPRGDELIELTARARGCILSGGRIDIPRTCRMVLKDLREARFGRISLQRPHQTDWSA